MTVVAVLALDHAIGFELMIPGQVFGMANSADAAEPSADSRLRERPFRQQSVETPRYEVRVCSQNRSVITVPQWGVTEIHTPFGLDALLDADIVIVPGTEKFLDEPHPDVIQCLRQAADRESRIAAVCVGAFTVAAAGLLDGLRATTHWQWAGELARRYPTVEVDPTVLFVDNGQILTSAGVASGLDLCLHLIRSDAGAELAAKTARRIVIPAWRDSGQAQYIEHPDPADTSHSLQSTIEWMEQNAGAELDLGAIAEHASISVRSLNRQFRAHVGTTPLQLLLRMRVDRARRLLETTILPMDRIAEESGFASHSSLRYHFVRIVGTPPQTYRSTYMASKRGERSAR
ncbi:GlxA family transcriptional regulator [Nocardia beijingensis]